MRIHGRRLWTMAIVVTLAGGASLASPAAAQDLSREFADLRQKVAGSATAMGRANSPGRVKTDIEDGVAVISMPLQVRAGDRYLLEKALRASGEDKKLLILDNPGGEVEETFALVQLLQRYAGDGESLSVYVPFDCASACVLLFASVPVRQRYAASDAIFRFHAASFRGVPDAAATRRFKDRLRGFLNASWLDSKDRMFSTVYFTSFFAREMARNGSGLIDSDLLMGYKDALRRIKNQWR